jgi:hypothetical protein
MAFMDTIPIEKIIRSRRRTISLIVTPNATLIVRAPMRTSIAYIENLVQEKSVWIQRKMKEMENRPAPPERKYINGEVFLYLGCNYPLRIAEPGVMWAPDLIRDELCVPCGNGADIARWLNQWYITESARILPVRVAWFAMITGNEPVSIRITDARQRWGSCSSTGSVNFSWRLVMAPLEIVDYVVVHELVHLEQPDHSKTFWEKVRDVLPDYNRRRKWLKENGRLLTL